MKQATVNLYQFNELSDEAKEKARAWWREGALDHDWWDSIYEDAATIGLKITAFDLDRNRHAAGRFTEFAQTVAANIMQNHGDTCETFKTAAQFVMDRAAINLSADDADCKLETLEAEFERSILEDYSIILQKEYEYLLSDEQVDEAIMANEYEFLESGKRFSVPRVAA